MILSVSLIIVALAVLFAGAESLVRSSSSVAARLGVSPLIIGLTVVAFGTSSPELVVSTKAALSGQGDIALGNVLGSNAFNIGVILGLTAIICPIPVHLQIIKFDAPVALAAAVLLPLLLIDGNIARVEGGLLFGLLVAYTAANVIMAKKEKVPGPATSIAASKHWAVDAVMIIGGLVLLVIGSSILVDNTIFISRKLGVSDAVMGLTVIAAGTSLPELATSVLAALRKQSDIAVGNIIGSNIFNILGIVGGCGLASPIQTADIALFDYVAVIIFTLMLVPMLYSGRNLIRAEGAVLLVFYGVYLWMLWPTA